MRAKDYLKINRHDKYHDDLFHVISDLLPYRKDFETTEAYFNKNLIEDVKIIYDKNNDSDDVFDPNVDLSSAPLIQYPLSFNHELYFDFREELFKAVMKDNSFGYLQFIIVRMMYKFEYDQYQHLGLEEWEPDDNIIDKAMFGYQDNLPEPILDKYLLFNDENYKFYRQYNNSTFTNEQWVDIFIASYSLFDTLRSYLHRPITALDVAKSIKYIDLNYKTLIIKHVSILIEKYNFDLTEEQLKGKKILFQELNSYSEQLNIEILNSTSNSETVLVEPTYLNIDEYLTLYYSNIDSDICNNKCMTTFTTDSLVQEIINVMAELKPIRLNSDKTRKVIESYFKRHSRKENALNDEIIYVRITTDYLLLRNWLYNICSRYESYYHAYVVLAQYCNDHEENNHRNYLEIEFKTPLEVEASLMRDMENESSQIDLSEDDYELPENYVNNGGIITTGSYEISELYRHFSNKNAPKELFLVDKLEISLAHYASNYKKNCDNYWETFKFDANFFNDFIPGDLLTEFNIALHEYIKPLNSQEINRYLTTSINQFKTHTPDKRKDVFCEIYHDVYWYPNYMKYTGSSARVNYVLHVWKLFSNYFQLFQEATQNTFDIFKATLTAGSIINIPIAENNNSKIESKSEKIKSNLSNYGFFEIPKVKNLTTQQKQSLLDLLCSKSSPYTIAMLDYIGFIKHLTFEHSMTAAKISKLIGAWLDMDTRAVKGNMAVLDEYSNENRNRYTADKHKENVKNDYQQLK